MAETVGRNQPCPCGSGKKYKNCCLPKEQQAKQQAASLVQQATPSRSPEVEAWDAHWERFEAADYEGRIAIFLETLESDLMDSEMAFEMLSELHTEAVKRDERARWADLVERLRQARPKIFQEDIGYYHSWLIEDALAQGRTEGISDLVLTFADNPDKYIDLFFNAIDALMYHGQVQPLLVAMQRALPKVKSSGEIMPHGVEEFDELLSRLNIFAYLDAAESPRPDDPALQERMRPDTIPPERLEKIIHHLSGQSTHVWGEADFGEQHSREQLNETLFFLSLDFLSDLRRGHGMPFSKGEIGRAQLVNYLRWQAKERRIRGGLRLLYPQRKSLDEFGGDLLHFLNPQFYKIGCLMEVLPFYLRFLVERQLMSDSEMRQRLNDLRSLKDSLCQLFRKRCLDPVMTAAVEASWAL